MSSGNTSASTHESMVIYSFGLFYLSACTAEDDDTTARFVNTRHPTGIDSAWHVADEPFKDGLPNGCPCEDNPTRRHLLFVC